MRDLWRKTFELFRRRPVLWLPYVGAEILAYCLWTLEGMSRKAILYWFAQTSSRSVLGGRTVTYDWANTQHRAILATAPLEWGTRYIDVCLLTAALLMTAVWVAEFTEVKRIHWGNTAKAVQMNAKRISIFALKFCVWMVVVVVVLLPLSQVRIYLHVGRTTYFPFSIAAELLAISIVTWIMAPAALVLLRPTDAHAGEARETRISRFFAILSIVCIAILVLAVPFLETHIQLRFRPEYTVLFALNDLVINLPLLFLFIALALLALEVPLNSAPEEALHLPRAIKNLMPLHYLPGDEQQ